MRPNLPLKNMLTVKKALGLFTLTITAFVAAQVSAQSYPQRNSYQDREYNQDTEYVTVYEDCDFRGKSRALSVGEYQDVQSLNIGNDSISSVEVPRGLRLVLFEHERLRGKSTLITSDVRCLNDSWNDETSSIRVNYVEGYQSNQPRFENRSRQNDRGEDYSNRQGYDNREDTRRGYENRGSDRRDYNNRAQSNRGRDYTKGVSYVAFANTAFEKGSAKQWRIVNRNGSVDTFRETARDRQTIYLRNNRVQQDVEIDLFSNQVRFYASNGKRIDYAVTSTQDNRLNRAPVANTPRQPSGVIPSKCFSYRAYTTGGAGGIRFHGHDGFHRFYKKGHKDRICHDGKLTMEINKNDPATEVIVEINGERYRFGKNEKADAFINTWYRKKVNLRVGR